MADPKTTSYGTTKGVAAYVPRYADTLGDFSAVTRPTHDQVVVFIDQVSSILNAVLGQEGFVVPITHALVVDMLCLFVEEEVASIAEGINGSGRFGPTTGTKTRGSRYQMIFDDIQFFVEANAVGIERVGATRTTPVSEGIGFRDVSEKGNPTFPIFQRDSFGLDGFFTDADPK